MIVRQVCAIVLAAMMSSCVALGLLTVQKSGSGSPAVVVVAGAPCGDVGEETAVRALATKHTVYAVRLAAFVDCRE